MFNKCTYIDFIVKLCSAVNIFWTFGQKNNNGLEILLKLKAKVNLKNCKQVVQTHFSFTIWGQKCIVSVLLKFKWIVTHLSCFQESKVQAVGLRVSDGRQNGNTVFLDLETFKLQIFVVNNTGLVLPMGTWTVISSVNLTYTTNAPDQSINLR